MPQLSQLYNELQCEAGVGSFTGSNQHIALAVLAIVNIVSVHGLRILTCKPETAKPGFLKASSHQKYLPVLRSCDRKCQAGCWKAFGKEGCAGWIYQKETPGPGGTLLGAEGW